MPDQTTTISTLRDAMRVFVHERDWEQFHSPKNLCMALSGEAAELSEHFQWLTEAQSAKLKGKKKQAVAEELADIFIYTVRLADKLQIDLERATRRKIKINARKYPVRASKGNVTKPSWRS